MQAIHGGRLRRSGHLSGRGFDECHERLGVPTPHMVLLAARPESLLGERSDRLEHGEPDPVVAAWIGLDEVLVGQAQERIQRVGPIPANDRFSLVEIEAALERGERAECRLEGRVEQVVAPRDRTLERPLALRSVS
jgi:hypothetical protein